MSDTELKKTVKFAISEYAVDLERYNQCFKLDFFNHLNPVIPMKISSDERIKELIRKLITELAKEVDLSIPQ